MAKKDLSNYIKGRTLKNKTIDGERKFILDDIFSKYDSIRKMEIDQEKIDAIEAKVFFKDIKRSWS